MKTHSYEVRLTNAEAVVLFELLRRTQDADAQPPLDAAEHAVVANLLGLLEGALATRVELGYADSVARAKRQLVGAR